MLRSFETVCGSCAKQIGKAPALKEKIGAEDIDQGLQHEIALLDSRVRQGQAFGV